MQQIIRVLFVCKGNICRSPIAEGIFRQLVRDAKLENRIDVDSAGTHPYHLGHPPDPRAIIAANSKGINITNLVARVVSRLDFFRFHYILAMDRSNLAVLNEIRTNNDFPKPRLLLEYAPKIVDVEILDPYDGTLDDYYQAAKLIYAGAMGLINDIKKVSSC